MGGDSSSSTQKTTNIDKRTKIDRRSRDSQVTDNADQKLKAGGDVVVPKITGNRGKANIRLRTVDPGAIELGRDAVEQGVGLAEASLDSAQATRKQAIDLAEKTAESEAQKVMQNLVRAAAVGGVAWAAVRIVS